MQILHLNETLSAICLSTAQIRWPQILSILHDKKTQWGFLTGHMQASEYFDIVWSLLPVTPRLVMGIKHGMSPMTPSDSLQESPLT